MLHTMLNNAAIYCTLQRYYIYISVVIEVKKIRFITAYSSNYGLFHKSVNTSLMTLVIQMFKKELQMAVFV